MPVIVSRFIEPLKKIFTPIITGSVIALIGISLIKVSVINWCGGGFRQHEQYRARGGHPRGYRPAELPKTAGCGSPRWWALPGCIAAGLSGQFHLHSLGDTLFRLPTLFPFGFQFNSAIFLPVAPCRWSVFWRRWAI